MLEEVARGGGGVIVSEVKSCADLALGDLFCGDGSAAKWHWVTFRVSSCLDESVELTAECPGTTCAPWMLFGAGHSGEFGCWGNAPGTLQSSRTMSRPRPPVWLPGVPGQPPSAGLA